MIIILIYIKFHDSECFANKHEKAESIYDWFSKTLAPTYNDYRTSVQPSNIVEYEDMLGLHSTKNFTVAKIEDKL